MSSRTDRVEAYLDAIRDVNRVEDRLEKSHDAAGLAQLGSALDAAKAAWLLIPAEWKCHLQPPPERKDC